jgi:NTE family protein
MIRFKRSPSILESPAIGTSRDDVAAMCPTEEPQPKAPPAATPAPAFALALSGGGFRATLCAIGVARFLADAGLLSRLRFSSSVSGGSVANGILACGYRADAADGFTGRAFDAHVLDPLVRRISRNSLTGKLVRGSLRILGRRTRSDLLAEAFDEWWFEGRALDQLPDDVRWIFNATNLTTGVGLGFERDVVGRLRVRPSLHGAVAGAARDGRGRLRGGSGSLRRGRDRRAVPLCRRA